jgi:homoserine dehydrogenase
MLTLKGLCAMLVRQDDSINCVIELMGGVTDAKDVVFKAIRKGKHVITANKALLAQHLPEIQELLKQVCMYTMMMQACKR